MRFEAAALGLTNDEIEAAINSDPMLALLADLANLGKHSVLTKIRSAEAPRFGVARAASIPIGEGWRLQMTISHLGVDHDALDLASEALGAWRRQLEAWKLL